MIKFEKTEVWGWEHIHMREVYEMDDTYPERYKLKELCNVDVEALNNEFKEVIHNV